jgi:acetyl-CoA C-acetyltransferase
MQGFNVTRTAWLTAGLPESVPATTIDSQCGSSQQAASIGVAHVTSGMEDVVLACGVELMSRVPLGSSLSSNVGKSISRRYRAQWDYTTQFEAAELIAKRWGISREDADQFGVDSQCRAIRAWAEGRFQGQIVPVDAPILDEDGKPTGDTKRVERDEGLRPSTLAGLAALKPVVPDGIHTAGTSSQIADGAAAVLLVDRGVADSLGLQSRARVVDTAFVATDPVLMLTGPIYATNEILERNSLSIDDIDVVENNEAFASVVLAWMAEHDAVAERVNPNGGAIALGHALGSTGVVLITKALHELERIGGRLALVTMCCGGGVATGTLIERVA